MPFEKGKSGNPAGRPPMGKSWADVLRKIGEEASGHGITKKEMICRKVYEEAENGEQWAINALFDRIDGKPKQQIQHSGDEENPIVEIKKTIVKPE